MTPSSQGLEPATFPERFILIGGVDIRGLSDRELRAARGGTISYVPQDPSTALNPALTIGRQLWETLDAHSYGANGDERAERVRETLREVLLPDDPEYLKRYPHQLSGGQQQRVVLAIAFACRPAVCCGATSRSSGTPTLHAAAAMLQRGSCAESITNDAFMHQDASVSRFPSRVVGRAGPRPRHPGACRRAQAGSAPRHRLRALLGNRSTCLYRSIEVQQS